MINRPARGLVRAISSSPSSLRTEVDEERARSSSFPRVESYGLPARFGESNPGSLAYQVVQVHK